MAARIQRDPTPVVVSMDTMFTGDYYRPCADLHPDGDRLIVPQNVSATSVRAGENAEPRRFLIVTNWFEELKRLVPN